VARQEGRKRGDDGDDVAEGQLAATVQLYRQLLPHGVTELGGLEVATGHRPCSVVGGDLFEFARFGDGHVGVVIADVSGHGLQAAAVMGMLKAVVLAAVRWERPTRTFAADVNEAMCELLADGAFVTAAFVEIDPRTGEAWMLNCGHPAVLYKPRSGPAVEVVCEGALPLGIMRWAGGATDAATGPATSDADVRLEPGDALVLYTDGLSEARDASGSMFDREGVAAALPDAASAGGLRDALLGAVEAHCGARPADDDRTVVVIRRPDGDVQA